MQGAMNQILNRLGMSNSTSKPEKQCDDCGKEINFIQIQHPFKDQLNWVPTACECVLKKQVDWDKEQKLREKNIRIKRALKLSSTMDDIKSMNFENYLMRNGVSAAYNEVKNAIENFEDRGKLGIFIFGETGNGKSHLTAAGGNALIKQGKAVIFITEKDLLKRLEATRNFNNPESFQEIMSVCVEADLLIWDDFLSSQRLSNDEKDWIFQIFNGRERAGKPVWATSNLTPEEFESEATAYKLDDKGRTWWRIIGNMECIYNKASNYRKSKAMARAYGITVDEYERKNENGAK